MPGLISNLYKNNAVRKLNENTKKKKTKKNNENIPASDKTKFSMLIVLKEKMRPTRKTAARRTAVI